MKTRESYLIRATTILRPFYRKLGYELPEVHVSVGFPSKRATSKNNRCIGQCWHGDDQKNGKAHLFISPVLDCGTGNVTSGDELLEDAISQGCRASDGGEEVRGLAHGVVRKVRVEAAKLASLHGDGDRVGHLASPAAVK